MSNPSARKLSKILREPNAVARTRALYIRSQSKIFCYNFNNPLGSVAGVNRNRLTLKSASNFLDFFCRCERGVFDPLLVINGLLLNNLDDLIV